MCGWTRVGLTAWACWGLAKYLWPGNEAGMPAHMHIGENLALLRYPALLVVTLMLVLQGVLNFVAGSLSVLLSKTQHVTQQAIHDP